MPNPVNHFSLWGPPQPTDMGTPPTLKLDEAKAFVLTLFAQPGLFGLLVAVKGEVLRRLAASALRYSDKVTAAVIQAFVELGLSDQVKDLARQVAELGVLEEAHQAHEEMYERETTTILARRDAIRALVAQLVPVLFARGEKDAQDPKVLKAVTHVKNALAEDEEAKKDAAKAREEGRSESLPLLAQRESELNDLRLHLDQRQKQVDFLNNKVAELEARLAGLSVPAAKNSRSTPR